MRKLSALPICLALLLGLVLPAQAQGQPVANLYPADVSAFPVISAFLDVFDANRIFASGLKPEAVTVLEDGQILPVSSLTELAIPLQLVVAVNQGPALDARDKTGFSRFQRVTQVLAGWAQTRPADLPDDFSLVSQAGPVISHAGAADFVVSLNAFQPDFRAATPNLQSLGIAIETVSQQTPRLGMKRAILFITPHMDDANIASAIQPYIQQAKERDIRVFVWFVDADMYFFTTSAAAFNTLAMESGGSMAGYSGVERLPDPEAYFAPLRRVYALSYESKITTAGEHKLSVQVKLPAGQAVSAEQVLRVDVQPPNPIFVSPPLQITRQAPPEDPFDTEILLPSEQAISIIVEFPDRHNRPLVRTTLYVDGQIADENTAEPFDQFTWDISAYTISGEHQMVVEAVDALGLSGTSMSIPVTLTVIKPPRGASALLARYRQPITFSAIAIAGLVLAAILLTGRLRVPSLREAREARRAHEDPLTQPIRVVAEQPVEEKPPPRKRRAAKKTSAAPKPKRLESAPASLIRLASDGQPATSNPIPLSEKEITFGTDPVQCSQVLDDPSLSSLHARLRRTEDGGYLLLDNNTIAGTWVNYEPVPREGYRLSHGDVIHFGQLIYRFTLRTHPAVPKPKVVLQKPEG
jgi:hypothetical protein